MADVVIDCMMTAAIPAGTDSDAARAVQLGAHLRHVGTMVPRDFDAFVRSAQQHRAAAFTTVLSGQLQTFGSSPAYWVEDVKRLIERLAQAPARPDFTVPTDLRVRHDVADARRLSQELVVKFGELLDAWPAVVDAATRLSLAGSRLSMPARAS